MDRLGLTEEKLDQLRGSKADEMLADVKKLAASGANLNAKNADGAALLHIAACNGFANVVLFLLQQPKIDVNVRDKDGISAALLVIEMAAELKEHGRLLTDALDDLSREHGIHATSQVSIRVSDLERITRIMHRLRASPPADVAGTSVITMDDLEQPTDGLPPTDGLRFTLAGGARIIVRPSGTEPKIKCYLEVIEHPAGGDLSTARASATHRMEGLRSAVAAWLE